MKKLKKVLLLEDNSEDALLIEKTLNKEGVEVSACLDENLAEKVYKDFAPQLILVDLMLINKSGIEVLIMLRKKGCNAPAVLLADRDIEMPLDVMDSMNIKGIVGKPINEKLFFIELMELIK